MSLVVLDTDVLTLYQFGDPTVYRHVQERASAELATTIITVDEQLSGWYKELRRVKKPPHLARIYDRMARTTQFLGRLNILTFSEPAILRWEGLKRLRLNIGKMDLRIAAIALEHNATVVTRNTADFGRVPGLTIEDWSK